MQKSVRRPKRRQQKRQLQQLQLKTPRRMMIQTGKSEAKRLKS
jgi:hypothetical protein